MKKSLYLIGGPMGVGKSAVGSCLKSSLPGSVYLDGDWCWDMHPFQVTEETRSMVMENISFLLNQFLHCSLCQHVILTWVMHRQENVDDLLSRLDTQGCQIHQISLVCHPELLRARLEGDVAAGRRKADVIPRSPAYLPLYQLVNGLHIDTSHRTAAETAADIIRRSCSPTL